MFVYEACCTRTQALVLCTLGGVQVKAFATGIVSLSPPSVMGVVLILIQLDGARFETGQTFSLRGDEVVRIDLVLPDIPDPIPVDPSTLPIQLEVEPLGPEAPEEGFHWR